MPQCSGVGVSKGGGTRAPGPTYAGTVLRRGTIRIQRDSGSGTVTAMSTGFDPDAAAEPGSGVFGLPHGPEEARTHVIPVPFDATASYRKGAARGPAAILRASRQVDLFDLATGRPYEQGIWMAEPDARIAAWNEEATALGTTDLGRVNAIGTEVNAVVEAAVAEALDAGRLPAVVGGDHSVPFGAFRAAAQRHPGLGILHFDAHADLRRAYEGFEWSHASIFRNVVDRIAEVERIVQVGVRDVGERELETIRSSPERIRTLFDAEWAAAALEGRDRRALVREWIGALPERVWVSFDVDGLDPALCPNTGTPVPGGLSWHDALLWLEELGRSDRRVVGVDLCEVNPGATSAREDSWDAIVGARLLYRLIGTALLRP